jgi:hypothetical protein
MAILCIKSFGQFMNYEAYHYNILYTCNGNYSPLPQPPAVQVHIHRNCDLCGELDGRVIM